MSNEAEETKLEHSLWKKCSSKSSVLTWVKRKFVLNVTEGILHYSDKNARIVSFYLNAMCIIQEIAGTYYGKENCIMILWSSGNNLLISFGSASLAKEWKSALYLTIFPTQQLRVLRTDCLHKRKQQNNLPHDDVQTLPIDHNNQNFLIKSTSLFHQYENALQKLVSCHSDCPLPSRTREGKLKIITGEMDSGLNRRSPSAHMRRQREEFLVSVGNPSFIDPRISFRTQQRLQQQYVPPQHLTVWDAFRKRFPDRHQEELKRFLVFNVSNRYVSYHIFISDRLIALFLTTTCSQDWDYEKAGEHLSKHILWRASNLPLLPSSCEEALKAGVCFHRGLDKSGYPVLYLYSNTKTATLSPNSIQRAMIYRIEQALANLAQRDGKITVIFLHRRALDVRYDVRILSYFAALMSAQYPERLNTLLVWRGGPTMYAALRLVLDRSSMRKVS